MTRRAVVTGMGVISPLGSSTQENWEKVLAGESAVEHISRFDASGFECKFGAEVREFEQNTLIKETRYLKLMSRATKYGLAAAELAVSDSGLEVGQVEPARLGVYTGSGDAGSELAVLFPALRACQDGDGRIDLEQFGTQGISQINPLYMLETLPNNAACFTSIAFNAQGPSNHIVQYSISGAQAIGEGLRAIQYGYADVVIAVGCESLSIAPFLTYYSLGLLSRKREGKTACRPFDRRRDGFVLGEGAGAVILEELGHAVRRNANIHGELAGYGNAHDAYDMIRLPAGGDGTVMAVSRALEEARLSPTEISYINLHGNGTSRNDKTETTAVKRVFGEVAYNIPTSSTKPVTGHLLAASGPVELIFCLLALRNNVIPPTMNLEEADPECDLNYTPIQAVEADVQAVLSITRGVSGQNAALIAKKYS